MACEDTNVIDFGLSNQEVTAWQTVVPPEDFILLVVVGSGIDAEIAKILLDIRETSTRLNNNAAILQEPTRVVVPVIA